MASDISPARQDTSPLAVGLPVYVIAAVIALGAALLLYLQYFSNRPAPDVPLTAEGQAYVRNLQLSDVTMQATESYMMQTVVEINGKIRNAGDRALDLVEIYCIFYDRNGHMLSRRRVPVVSRRMGGLKPGESKSFRLPFDDLPQGWNQVMPQLVIAGVKFS